MKRIQVFTGGHPFKADDLKIMSDGVLDAFKAICEGLTGSTTRVLSGCAITYEAGPVTAGWVYHNGEIYPVDAVGVFPEKGDVAGNGGHPYFIFLEELLAPSLPNGTTYADLSLQDVHIRRYAEVWQVDTITFDLSPYDYVLASSVQTFLGSWITPTLTGSFTQDITYPVQYRKNLLGQLEIRGKCKCSTEDASGTLFTLEVGCRPSLLVQKSFLYDLTTAYLYDIVPASGVVQAVNWNPDIGLNHVITFNDIIII